MAPQQPATPGAMPGAKPFTSQQNAQMTFLAKQAVDTLTDEKVAQFIVDKVQAGDPVEATAGILAQMLQSLFVATQESGKPADVEVILAAGMQALAAVAKLLASEGIIEEAGIPEFCAKVATFGVTAHNKRAAASKGQQPAEQPAQAAQPTGMMGAQPAGV